MVGGHEGTLFYIHIFSYNQRTLSCQWLLAVVQAGPRLRYGRITYSGDKIKKSADNGSITVIKAAGSYYFRFSDGIPDLKGVTFKKEGDHTLVNIDLKEGVKIIRINASSLNILYTKDGKIWTANGKR